MSAQSTDKSSNRIKGYIITHLTGGSYEVNVVYERGILRVDSHTCIEDFPTLKEATDYISDIEADTNLLP